MVERVLVDGNRVRVVRQPRDPVSGQEIVVFHLLRSLVLTQDEATELAWELLDPEVAEVLRSHLRTLEEPG